MSARPEKIAHLVFLVRGEKVMLDADLAMLYGVETGALNRAVKRNEARFPSDFMFQVTSVEWDNLKCQIGISSSPEGPSNARIQRPGLVNPASHGGLRVRPHVFTEHGIAMLSSVLRSPRAAEVNIAIMRTFVQLRRLMDSNRDLARRIDTLEKRYDEQFSAVFDAIKRLISESDDRKSQPKRRIGFLS